MEHFFGVPKKGEGESRLERGDKERKQVLITNAEIKNNDGKPGPGARGWRLGRLFFFGS